MLFECNSPRFNIPLPNSRFTPRYNELSRDPGTFILEFAEEFIYYEVIVPPAPFVVTISSGK